ncbi:BON domain-containing protein [Frateuria sp. MAH-13]|uniref:BON domain-containing protein n=1 Tax=Frateuria flava TaxID=2821489 RepID=A0ABS4DI98_9GAMM|nr:BON domain-containing protein [Frateuria flava]
MARLLKLAAAFAAGAAAMYLLDPVAGRRRRAMARDRVRATGQDIQDFAQDKVRHAADRLHGAASHLQGHAPSDDRQLHDRIRSKLGHLVAQPGRVEVHVEDGLVTLGGSVGRAEVDGLVAALTDMPGVAHVDNRLDASEPSPSSERRH